MENMSDDSLPIELDDLPMPELPVWVSTLLLAISAIVPIPAEVAFAALSSLCAPLQAGGMRRAEFLALPTSVQDQIRAAKSAKLAAINVAERAPATQRQVIPVVQASVPVAPPVLTGTWTRIQSGPHAGEWGARIDNVRGLQTGQLVRLYKRGATRGSLHAVVAFGMRDNAAICAVRDATDAERTSARGTTPADGVPVVTSDQPSDPTVEQVIPVVTETADSGEVVTPPVAAPVAAPVVPYFERPRSERTGFQVGSNATPSERSRIMGERDLVVGALATDTGESWLQVSWTGGGETESGKVDDALTLISRENDAPGVPGAEGYAGAAVAAMRNAEYDVKRLAASAVPEGCQARWLIGRALGGDSAARAGDAYGTALLIVDLTDDDTLRFDGDTTLAGQVRGNYAASTVKKALDSRTMTPWMGRILRTRHGAVKRGHNWYVPPGHAQAVRELISAIEPLWGDFDVQGVMTRGDLFNALSKGLSEEVTKVERELADKTEEARRNALKREEAKAGKLHGATEASIKAAGDLAYRRASIGGTLASRLLRDLGTAAARVSAYRQVFGDEIADPIVTRIATIREALSSLADDTSARAAMLELD